MGDPCSLCGSTETSAGRRRRRYANRHGPVIAPGGLALVLLATGCTLLPGGGARPRPVGAPVPLPGVSACHCQAAVAPHLRAALARLDLRAEQGMLHGAEGQDATGSKIA
jgi:hypothetical protein